MTPNFRTWLIRIMVALIACTVIAFAILMIVTTMEGRGTFPTVPNPTGKGGAVFPITMVVLIPIVIAVLGYGAIIRLLKRHRTNKPSRQDKHP